MDVKILQWVVWPQCAERQWQSVGEAVRCTVCGCRYPVQYDALNLLPGGPHFLTPAQRTNFTLPVAWGYEDLWRRRSLSLLSGRAFGIERELALLDQWMAGAGAGVFLDLACSHGLYARSLARGAALHRLEREVIALDSSLLMLQQAAAKIRHANLTTVHLLCAEGESLPLPASSLDGIVCGGSLNEFKVADLVVAEAARVLKPGAPFFSMHLLGSELRWGQRLQGLARQGGVQFWDTAAVQAMFARHGLRLAQREQFGIVEFALFKKEGR